MNELLSANELAKYLGVSKYTVYRWVKNNQVPFVRLGGSLRFNLKEVLKDESN